MQIHPREQRTRGGLILRKYIHIFNHIFNDPYVRAPRGALMGKIAAMIVAGMMKLTVL